MKKMRVNDNEGILNLEWVTRDGDIIRYGDMEPRHLFYATRMIIKRMKQCEKDEMALRNMSKQRYNEYSTQLTSDSIADNMLDTKIHSIHEKYRELQEQYQLLIQACNLRYILYPQTENDIWDEDVHIIKPYEEPPVVEPTYDIH